MLLKKLFINRSLHLLMLKNIQQSGHFLFKVQSGTLSTSFSNEKKVEQDKNVPVNHALKLQKFTKIKNEKIKGKLTNIIDIDKEWEIDRLIYTDFNNEQYSSIVNYSNVLIHFKTGLRKKMPKSDFLEILNDENRATVLEAFIKNPKNWGLIFDKLNKYSCETKNESKINQNISIENYLIESISITQHKETKFEFYAKLAEALTQFLMDEIYKIEDFDKIEFETSKLDFKYFDAFVRIKLAELDKLIAERKKSIPSLLKTDLEFQKRHSDFSSLVTKIMKNFKSINDVPILMVPILLKSFCILPDNFDFASQMVLKGDLNKDMIFILKQSELINNIIRGSIRMEKHAVFEKLIFKVKELNDTRDIDSIQNLKANIFSEYFCYNGKNLEKDLERLFKSWEIFMYQPIKKTIEELKEFVKR